MKAHCLIILATAFAGAAFGDEKPSATAPAPAPAPASARPSPPELPMVSPVGAIEERVKKLHETVALSQDQQEKLKAILTKNDAAMTAAIAAWRTGHTPEDRQKLRDLLNAQNAAIRSLLTEAQKQKGQTAAAQTGIGGGGGGPAGGAGPGAGGANPGASSGTVRTLPMPPAGAPSGSRSK